MANISNLITDVQQVLSSKGWMTPALAEEHARRVSTRMQEQFSPEPRKGSLRLSQMGPWCPRALWASVNRPEEAEDFPPWAINKFSHHHMVECWALTLARAAGHSVEGEQDVVTVDGVEGHRDCVVDGYLVDIKGTSSRQYLKFKEKTLAHSDLFGYMDQLDGYLVGCLDDPIVKVKDVAYDWAIGVEKGHMCLYEHRLREQHIRNRIQEYKKIVALQAPPPCSCGTVPDGSSGNIKLDVRASYNQFKYFCLPQLRTFIYASGPVYLTKVERRPRNQFGPLMEVDRYGKVVYNG